MKKMQFQEEQQRTFLEIVPTDKVKDGKQIYQRITKAKKSIVSY